MKEENNKEKNKKDSKPISGPEATRVRFAPSPTGYLHIGSARTAFFNWLFARKTRGKFILRIEDTDISRHIEEAINLIMESLKWLGLNWDEGPDMGGNFGPYRQSQRKDLYFELAKKLITNEKAYYCFCSQEKLADKRKSFMAKKGVKENLKKSLPYAIRLLVPDDYEIAFDDLVYGHISVNSSTQEDFIIIRSNGLPTYNFSAAVDDILMEITHVIRGEDHLSNTPKQILIYNALGASLPVFTHLPMILGADGRKLSKRHGSISIEAYRDEGFLPKAIRNYLALLGWAYDEKTTIFSLNEILNKFELKEINKRPARFDYEKLLWLNGHYIRQMSDKDMENLLISRLDVEKNLKFKDVKSATEKIIPYSDKEVKKDTNVKNAKNSKEFLLKISKIVPLIKERVKTLKEAEDIAIMFFNDIEYENDFIKYIKTKKEFALEVIDDAIFLLKQVDDFSHANIEPVLRSISEKKDLNFRKIAEIIRAAIWGSRVSPPMFKTMEIFGKNICLKRLEEFKKIIA